MAMIFKCSSEYLSLEPNDSELPRKLEVFISNWMIEHGVFEVKFSLVPFDSLDEG